jgi:spore coat polysaccharide biosynthesis protein SpsF
MDDADLLLTWANDPTTRSAGFHPDAIDPATHRAWLAARLASSVTRLFIGNDSDDPIGQVRFEHDEDGLVEVGVSVAPDARGRGHGRALVETGVAAVLADAGERVRGFVARIRPDNAASIALFEAAGFRAHGPDTVAGVGCMRYTRDGAGRTPLVVAIVQARTGSTRLPGKVLLPLGGEPILSHVLRRTARARRIDRVVVATTTDPADDAIVDLADRQAWTVVRGSLDDVLDRYLMAARLVDADVVVRITSDCPLIDPDVIDAVVDAFLAGDALDYASNTLEPRTFPRGLDLEVIDRLALARAWREDRDPAWREHVTPYLYRHPERFRLHAVRTASDHSDQRWVVDTAEDYELVRRIVDALERDDFTWHDVLAVIGQHPDWIALNRGVRQKTVPPGRTDG